MGFGGAHSGQRLIDGALALFLAPACASCAAVLESPLSGPICDECWRAVPPAASPWQTPGGVRVDAAAPYDGSLRNIIHAWKFECRQSLARPLAHLVRERCGAALADVDLAVPVPMTPWRRWRRGFNQAEDLAKALGPRRSRALARWRPRPAQATLHVDERRVNLSAAISVPRWQRGRVRGRVVLLVDDVVTTGATLDACASALVDAGAADVRAVAVARTLLKSVR